MKISKVNEVYLELEVDEDVSRELSDYFTFEVPGAKFMPQYRNRMWDGKIRLFSPNATDGFSVFSQTKRGSSVVYNLR